MPRSMVVAMQFQSKIDFVSVPTVHSKHYTPSQEKCQEIFIVVTEKLLEED